MKLRTVLLLGERTLCRRSADSRDDRGVDISEETILREGIVPADLLEVAQRRSSGQIDLAHRQCEVQQTGQRAWFVLGQTLVVSLRFGIALSDGHECSLRRMCAPEICPRWKLRSRIATQQEQFWLRQHLGIGLEEATTIAIPVSGYADGIEVPNSIMEWYLHQNIRTRSVQHLRLNVLAIVNVQKDLADKGLLVTDRKSTRLNSS